MSDTKLLQAILDGQRAIKEELKGDIAQVGKDIAGVKEDIRGLDKKLEKTENKLTERIDKLGLQIARLEDDAPTIDEFEKLIRRVTKLENKFPEN